MSKRHHLQIALVGGSPTPVYQGILHLKPNQVILVCSESTKEVADNIRGQLPMYEDKDVLRFEMSDNDLEKMYQTAELIEQSVPKGITVSMNITGGMKLWSVIFNNVFRRRRRSCHTFCIGQNGSFFDLKEKMTKGKVDFDMDAQFKILGHSLDEYTPLSEYTSEDFNALDKLTRYIFSKLYVPFALVTAEFVKRYQLQDPEMSLKSDFDVTMDIPNKKKPTQRPTSASLIWNAGNKTFTCKIQNSLITLGSPHIADIVLNTGWFELYTARMIAESCGNKDIRLNCKFKYAGRKQKNDKNEIDIILNTGSKLIFVECKTQVYNSTDVDKFNSAVRNYGGLGSRPLFVTYSSMSSDAQEKCKDHGITTFHFNDPHTTMSQTDKVEALAKVIDGLNKTWNYK